MAGERNPARYKKGYWLTKDNKLISIHGNMTPLGYKLTNFFLWMAVKEGRLDNLQVNAADLVRAVKLKDTAYGEILKEESKQLPKTTIEIQKMDDPDKITSLAILPTVEYDHGKITAKVNPDLKTYIINLAGNFTPLELEKVYLCGTYPAMRLYEVCCSWKRIGYVLYSVEEWRGLLGATKDSYDVFAQFKRRVLLPAINAVNEKADINVKAEYIKSGRKTTHIKMHIAGARKEIDYLEPINEGKNREEELPKVEEGKTDIMAGLNEREADCVKRMVDVYNLKEEIAVRYVRGYGILYCQENMEYVRNVKKAGNARNPGGYLIQALENDYAGSHKANERAKEQEKAEHADKAEWNRTARERIIPESENNMADNEDEKLQAFRRILRVELNQALTAGKINFIQYQKIWGKVANDETALLEAIETKNIDMLLGGADESNLEFVAD